MKCSGLQQGHSTLLFWLLAAVSASLCYQAFYSAEWVVIDGVVFSPRDSAFLRDNAAYTSIGHACVHSHAATMDSVTALDRAFLFSASTFAILCVWFFYTTWYLFCLLQCPRQHVDRYIVWLCFVVSYVGATVHTIVLNEEILAQWPDLTLGRLRYGPSTYMFFASTLSIYMYYIIYQFSKPSSTSLPPPSSHRQFKQEFARFVAFDRPRQRRKKTYHTE